MTLSFMAVKAGRHQFDQYFISDEDLYDSQDIDRSHESYRQLCMGRMDIVGKYIETLETLYTEHWIIIQASDLYNIILNTKYTNLLNIMFNRFDRFDKEHTTYMLVAIKSGGHPHPNGICKWSPCLEKCGPRINYWKLRMNLRLEGLHHSSRLEQF